MPSTSVSIDTILERLAETPRRIAALTAGLTSAQLHAAPGPEEWSANDVLAHLRACADVWGAHIEAILAEDEPTRQGVNPRTWITKTNYLDQKFRPSLRSFTQQRTELLALIEPLPSRAWSRTATVLAWNVPFRRTMVSFAEHLARHERTHLKQFKRIAERVSA
jgi:uncharacterized damage-inducible protein DinB